MTENPLQDGELFPLLRSFVLKAQETILITDADTASSGGPRILLANDAAGPGLAGRRLDALYPAETLTRLIDQMRHAARTGSAAPIEVPVASPDDKPVWMEMSVTALSSPAGGPTHFVWTGRDVTQRKRAEAERETTQRLLASVFGTLDQALGVIDDQDRFAMVNTAVTRQFGWSVFDLIGKPYGEILAPADREAIERQLSDENEMTWRLPTRLRHLQGDLLHGEIVVTTIPQPDGRPYRVMMMIQHAGVPADRSFEQAIRRALQEAGKAGTVVAGQIQLVGLDEMRAAAGDRWRAISDRAFQAAEAILSLRLAETDVFSRTADDGYLICFTELKETEAQFKARTIANEIRIKLAGESPELAEVGARGFATRVAVEADDMMPETAIVNALEARLARERKRLEDIAFRAMRAKLATSDVLFQTIWTENGQAAPLMMTRLPRDLDDAQSTLLALGRTEYVPQSEMLLLTGATERILAELSQERTELILTPIRLATLNHKRDSEHWMSVARTIGPPGKKRLVVEIRELGPDTTRIRLSDATMMVSPLFRTVAYELPTIDPGFVTHLPVTAALATIEAPLLGENATIPVSRVLKALLPRRCRLIVKNVDSPALAATLIKAGVTLMTMRGEEQA